MRRSTKCVVVEVTAGNLRAGLNPEPRDLLPWADPYIAALLHKHELQLRLAGDGSAADGRRLHGEASPPLGDDYPLDRYTRRGGW